jgi:hypothetical protein
MVGTDIFLQRARDTLARFCTENPAVRIILLDRSGKIILEAP